ncbi:E3 ubiquitin-protein ligase ipaH3 [Pararobbsia alpina]|uniref:E3 ubiquitin-protein ligase ipaH3 n=2 Tax=Pararobbsia alpina TaxID=621374 RepID=A0A6S7BGT6_9BURK|nr:E3 ubiquitin-protein ligase ipaH3 [Pararobbsia alpina]
MLGGNPLSERTRAGIAQGNPDVDTTDGPRISFTTGSGDAWKPASQPIEQAVADWYPESRRDEIVASWADIDIEPGSSAFSIFLGRLRDSVNIHDEAFGSEVRKWLTTLSNSRSQRETTFDVALDASETCEDRAALAFVKMQIATISEEVQSGAYDHRMDELVSRARQVFRHTCLESIAAKKVPTLRFADEIEVHLAFQVKLNEVLQLGWAVRDMRFFDVSGVTESDLAKAMTEVQTQENEQFGAWLACWSPWGSMLKRHDCEKYNAVQNALYREEELYLEGEVNDMHREVGLENDMDVRVGAGKAAMEAIERRLKIPLTMDFLANQGKTHLLDPVWNTSVDT